MDNIVAEAKNDEVPHYYYGYLLKKKKMRGWKRCTVVVTKKAMMFVFDTDKAAQDCKELIYSVASEKDVKAHPKKELQKLISSVAEVKQFHVVPKVADEKELLAFEISTKKKKVGSKSMKFSASDPYMLYKFCTAIAFCTVTPKQMGNVQLKKFILKNVYSSGWAREALWDTKSHFQKQGIGAIYQPASKSYLEEIDALIEAIRDDSDNMPVEEAAAPVVVEEELTPARVDSSPMFDNEAYVSIYTPEDIEAAASDARALKQGLVIEGVGKPVRDGQNGQDGEAGKPGEEAKMQDIDGGNGGMGEAGYDGVDGMNGEDGINGNNVIIDVHAVTRSGENPKDLVLSLTGSCEGDFILKGDQTYILVDSRGSNGGDGGDGGIGGNGGNGARGANGLAGKAGTPGNDEHRDGTDGERGGNGGNGGNGGPAGMGGSAGAGGRGGNGGRVVIRTKDARDFFLFGADVRPGKGGACGKKGEKGEVGKAGAAGAGGEGGAGGAGKRETRDEQGLLIPAGQNGKKGEDGNEGMIGRDGNEAESGRPAEDGMDGEPGSISFVLMNEQGAPIASYGNLYDAKVDNFALRNEFGEDFIQPGKKMIVSDIALTNFGGMELPAQCKVEMLDRSSTKGSSKKVNFEGPILTTIAIPTGQSAVFKETMVADAIDRNAMVAGRYRSEATIQSQLSFHDRIFGQSKITKSIEVKYPLFIESHTIPSFLALGQTQEVSVTIRNESTRTFGESPNHNDPAEVNFFLAKPLTPSAKSGDTSGVFNVGNVKSSVMFPIHEIGPGQTVTFAFDVRIDETARLFERIEVISELRLADKKIEFATGRIRVAPNYPTGDRADALVVTSSLCTRKQYASFNNAFDMLGMKFDLWDIERQNGFSTVGTSGSRHENTWVGSYLDGVMCFADCEPSTLKAVDPLDLLHQLKDTKDFILGGKKSLGSVNALDFVDSGSVFFGAKKENVAILLDKMSEICEPAPFPVPGKIKKATKEDGERAAAKAFEAVKLERPVQQKRMAGFDFNPEKKGKATYLGTLNAIVNPICNFDRIIGVINSDQNNYADEIFDEKKAVDGERAIPLVSTLCQTLLAVYSALSMKKKVALYFELGEKYNVLLPNLLVAPIGLFFALCIRGELFYEQQYAKSSAYLEKSRYLLEYLGDLARKKDDAPTKAPFLQLWAVFPQLEKMSYDKAAKPLFTAFSKDVTVSENSLFGSARKKLFKKDLKKIIDDKTLPLYNHLWNSLDSAFMIPNSLGQGPEGQGDDEE